MRTPPFGGLGFGRGLCPSAFALDGALRCRDGRAVTADVADDLACQVFFDEGLVNTLSQAAGGERFKGPRERGLAGQCGAHRKTADSAQ